MGIPSENQLPKQICAGILAHVDAGKTTLAESLLYLTGAVRRLGRVDHQDAFLDTDQLEKSRGITIFSKMAQLPLPGLRVTLLDTPGHVDFSAEMERTLQVLDYAILVISAADGVSGHVQTLWRLLKEYRVPVFLFINKMDQEGADREGLLRELQRKLDERCLDFSVPFDEAFAEQAAVTDEALLEYFLEHGTVEQEQLIKQIAQRKLFPCYFGSALKLWGVQELLEGFAAYTQIRTYGKEFGARVFKIARDSQGTRLTYLKVTGGCLKVKQVIGEGKADQLRLYSGSGFSLLQEAPAGTVCAVTGLEDTCIGQGLGAESDAMEPILEPVLTYRITFPQGQDVHDMFRRLAQLEEEEPQLHLVWQEETQEIHAHVMGEVQIEVLESLISKRFGVAASFTSGSIIYKETIENCVEGVGHFEPLRHYAEVHLLLEPGEPGSGRVYESTCSEDVLAKNWQRLILTHLEEKIHKGVLTGSELTDVRITLISGRAHIRHTEGGDFRQATYRAVRQGLMQAKSRLLEPVYRYRLELPAEALGRAMNDIRQMGGTFLPPGQEGGLSVLTGTAPVSKMRGYQREVVAYTRGRGRLSCTVKGYEPEADLANTPDSVFCAHGAGFVVPWYQVPDYMHLEGLDQPQGQEALQQAAEQVRLRQLEKESARTLQDYAAEDDELKAIFERTYGPIRQRGGEEEASHPAAVSKKVKPYRGRRVDKGSEYLLVDGYNIIFAWKELKELAMHSIDAARLQLMDILSNYQGYCQSRLILVFDAYKVKGGQGSIEKYHNIHVVYTREAETADQYIEKTVHDIGRKHQVTVATSDGLEQVIILGQGGTRMSAANLKEAVESAGRQMRELRAAGDNGGKAYLFEEVKGEAAEAIERVRLGLEDNDRKG